MGVKNTVVVYVSDHGDMMGDQGFWTKQVMYEQSAGVPMIMAGPGVPKGRRVETATSLVDLAATARDVTGVAEDEASRALPGVSRAPSSTGASGLETSMIRRPESRSAT